MSRVLPVQDFEIGEIKRILDDVEIQLEYEFTDNVEPRIDKPSTSKYPEPQIKDNQSLTPVEVYEQVDSPASSHESFEPPENEVQQDWNLELISEFYKWLKNKTEDRTKWKPNAEGKL